MTSARSTRSRSKRRWALHASLVSVGILLVAWLLAAYGFLPFAWRDFARHLDVADEPYRTETRAGLPGDPVNVGLIGSHHEVIRAFHAAGWFPANAITFRSSVGIVESVGLRRPDPDAPVSNLYLWGRHQDLAFEKPVGRSARERHHVRLWAKEPQDSTRRGTWLGAATFDRRVGLSDRTAQFTHIIAPDVDAERDTVMANLAAAGQLIQEYVVAGMGPTVNGRNGDGDWFYTDGAVHVGVLSTADQPQTTSPERLSTPFLVRAKNLSWRLLRLLLPNRQPGPA